MTASWDKILYGPGSCAHVVELTRPAERRAGQSAGRFLAGALQNGGVAVAIATPRNAEGIITQLARMGLDPVTSLQRERMMLMESSATLSRFLRGQTVDAQEFDRTIGAAMRTVCERAGDKPLRAFGDMVGILWQRGNRQAAVDLEKLWNRLQEELHFGLYCAYPIDVFEPEFSPGNVNGILESHTHLLPADSSADLGRVLDRALDEVLGEEAPQIRSRIGSRARHDGPAMPKPEQIILWLRSHVPEFAEAVLDRARVLYDAAAPRVYLRS